MPIFEMRHEGHLLRGQGDVDNPTSFPARYGREKTGKGHPKLKYVVSAAGLVTVAVGAYLIWPEGGENRSQISAPTESPASPTRDAGLLTAATVINMTQVAEQTAEARQDAMLTAVIGRVNQMGTPIALIPDLQTAVVNVQETVGAMETPTTIPSETPFPTATRTETPMLTGTPTLTATSEPKATPSNTATATATDTPEKVLYECVNPDQTPENPEATVLVADSTMIAVDGEKLRCESDIPGEHPNTYVATGVKQTETPVP